LGKAVFGRPFVRLEAIESPHSPSSGPILAIGDRTYLGFHVSIFATRKINIGQDAYLNGHVTLYDHYPPLHRHPGGAGGGLQTGPETEVGEVLIGDRAWLGWGSVVLPGVRVGVHAVLGANSVATEDIPDHCVAVGNPSRVVRRYDPDAKAWRPVSGGQG
jgi:maltose O-acetyltransferase